MKKNINVFFASDEAYLPFLSVAIRSLDDHASDKYIYNIIILTEQKDSLERAISKIKVKENVRLLVSDVKERIKGVKSALSLRLRDYYSESIYYRLFIPSMFPKLDRAVYLDSDIALNDDIAKLYFTDIGDSIVGAVSDESVLNEPVFCDYVKKHVGLLRADSYFNSGVLLMDLSGMRRERIEEKFVHLISKYNFETIAPDQDYLNFLCKGKVYYFGAGWNKHAIAGTAIPSSGVQLMHYNMFGKPWHYEGVMMEELFWKYAKETPFYASLKEGLLSYTDEDRARDLEGARMLLSSAAKITEREKCIADVIADGYFKAVGIV